MDFEDTADTKSSEREKPRRLEDETATYLTQILPQLESLLEAAYSEDLDVLVENVLLEIKQRSASAMCDRRTFIVMEKLCFASSFKNLLDLFEKSAPYTVFLARNRHSSHVLQAMFSRLSYLLKFQSLPEDFDVNEFGNQIIEFSRPLFQEISWLIKDLNASHVIRSCLCTLSGLPTIAERKGKGSKHQHSVSYSQPLDALKSPTRFYIDVSHQFSVPFPFQEFMSSPSLFENLLSSCETSELQSMIADPTSCAVFGLLIRIFSNPLLHPQGPDDIVTPLIHRIFDWTSPIGGERGGGGEWRDLIYAMAGDKSGSYFLETVLECASLSSVVLRVCSEALCPKLMEYVRDGCANFVIQSAMKRLSAELQENAKKIVTSSTSSSSTSSTSKKSKTSKEDLQLSQDLLSVAVKMLSNAMMDEQELRNQEEEEDKDSFTHVSKAFKQLVQFKGGVVMWMVELAREIDQFQNILPSSSSETLLFGSRIGLQLIQVWCNGEKKEEEDEEGKKEEIEKDDPKKTEKHLKKKQFKKIRSQLIEFFNLQFSPKSKEIMIEESTSSSSSSQQPTITKPSTKSSSFVTPQKEQQQKDTKQLLLGKLIGSLIKLASSTSSSPLSSSSTTSSSTSTGFSNVELGLLICSSLSQLSSPSLLEVACSGQLSRAILDPLFDFFSSSSSSSSIMTTSSSSSSTSSSYLPTSQSLFQQFFTSFLLPNTFSLATSFVGQHILRRFFELSSKEDKELVVQSLIPYYKDSHFSHPSSSTSLTTTAQQQQEQQQQKQHAQFLKDGKNSIKFLSLELYSRRPEDWRAAMHRQGKAQDMLKELFDETPSSFSSSSPPSSSPPPAYPSSSSSASSSSSNSKKTKKSTKTTFDVDEEREGMEETEKKNEGEDNQEDEDEDGEKEEGGGKRKRKRKRKNAANSSSPVLSSSSSPSSMTIDPSESLTTEEKEKEKKERVEESSKIQIHTSSSVPSSSSFSSSSISSEWRGGEDRRETVLDSGRGGRGGLGGRGRGRGRGGGGRGDFDGQGRGRGERGVGSGRDQGQGWAGRGRGRGGWSESSSGNHYNENQPNMDKIKQLKSGGLLSSSFLNAEMERIRKEKK